MISCCFQAISVCAHSFLIPVVGSPLQNFHAPWGAPFSGLKGHSTRILKNLRKNHKKYVYQHDPIAILATYQVKKVLREKISCFPLRIQISAILFQVDCAINQIVISISSLAEYWVIDSLSEEMNAC